MADRRRHLSHLLVRDRSTDQEFRRRGWGGGDSKVRPIEDRATHGKARIKELNDAIAASENSRDDDVLDAELRALGTVVTLEGEDAAFPLKLDSLERLAPHSKNPQRPQRPRWLLLSVLPADSKTGLPERATVWVSDEHRDKFLKLFEDYLTNQTATGKPTNRELVANIARIRRTVLTDLWQSDGEPDMVAATWWEVWLRPGQEGPELLRRYAQTMGLAMSPRILLLSDRAVTWIQARWSQLEPLPFTAVPVAEIRRPEFIDTIEDLVSEEQAEYVDDLAARLDPAPDTAPAVCHLDTGVARTHLLLERSLDERDLHTVVTVSGFDRDGHGTKMAGIALFGDLDEHLTGSDVVPLRHRLESVRILPTAAEPQHNPLAYGDVTAQAVALPEITSTRRRVFCMPVSTTSDSPSIPGQPTLWSATLDALAAGTPVVRNGDELQLLGPPEPDSARLIVVSAAKRRRLRRRPSHAIRCLRDPRPRPSMERDHGRSSHRIDHPPNPSRLPRVDHRRRIRRTVAAQPNLIAVRCPPMAHQA